MKTNMEDIKILIIEDIADEYNNLKTALKDITIQDNNIYPKNHNILCYTDISKLYIECKNIIEDNRIDIVFFDLALQYGEDASDGSGAELIKKFLQNEDIRFIPKIILSGANNLHKLDDLVEQDTKITLTKQDNLKKLLVDNNLNQTIPIFANLYRELKKGLEFKKELTDIKYNIRQLRKEIINSIIAEVKTKENLSKKDIEDIIKFKIPFGFGELDLNLLYEAVDNKLMEMGIFIQNIHLDK